jgi:hypothetical protein
MNTWIQTIRGLLAAPWNLSWIHSTIKITLDVYGHLFDDMNFTKQQVEILENSFDAVRKTVRPEFQYPGST